jgi:hypothetical protein
MNALKPGPYAVEVGWDLFAPTGCQCSRCGPARLIKMRNLRESGCLDQIPLAGAAGAPGGCKSALCGNLALFSPQYAGLTVLGGTRTMRRPGTATTARAITLTSAKLEIAAKPSMSKTIGKPVTLARK